MVELSSEIRIRIFVLLLVFLAPPSPVFPSDKQKVVDKDEKGRVVAEYTVDSAGRRHGTFKAFDGDGNVTTKATYKNGLLNGAYREYFPDKKIRSVATYRKGVLDGPVWRKTVDGRKTSVQRWKKGVLQEYEGIRFPFARSRADLVGEMARIRAVADDVRFDKWENERLRELKLYRFLGGVDYRHIKLDVALNEEAALCAELCRELRSISHDPRNPGWPAAKYAKAYQAARKGNLANGKPERLNHLFMNDSNAANVSRLGHRRWSLNPFMGKVGYGKAGSYSVMWAHDDSYSPRDTAIHPFPYPGWVPLSMIRTLREMGDEPAWNVSYDGQAYELADNWTVKIQPLDDRLFPMGKPATCSDVRRDSSPYGKRPALIFRPVGLKLNDGSAFLVTITGLSPKEGGGGEHRYLLRFFDDASVKPGK